MPETHAAWLVPALAFVLAVAVAGLACWRLVRRAARRRTAELHACEPRQQLEKRLRQAQATEEILLSTQRVAHGFRNLLGTIPGYCDLALDALPADSPARADIAQIRTQTERALLLVKQVLTPETGHSPAAAANLNAWVADVGARLAKTLPAGITVEYRLAENAGTITVDLRQLERAFTNIVCNARDAMPQGGKLTVETAAIADDRQHAGIHAETRLGPHLMLAVTDTGQGMDAATLSRAFEPFFTTKGKGTGAGLGLFTARGIVRLYDGVITAESAPGHGSTFRICLPSAGWACATAAEAGSSAQVMHVTGQTILVVEDEEAVRRFVCDSLVKAGYEVMAASDGAEALARAAGHAGAIHLLLTDVTFPGMDGTELYDKLASLRPGLPVLYISGYTQDVIAPHGVLAPATHFLPKPFSVRDLTGKVREVLAAS